MGVSYTHSFLKYPGGKLKLLNVILPLLPPGQRFIEPFVGSGVVFINTEFSEYIIGDINKDLISLYKFIGSVNEQELKSFLYRTKFLFDRGNNKEYYNDVRNLFNEGGGFKNEQFIYLNRHGFNGLCRYNKNGKYNVPFGQYKSVYFPNDELFVYSKKLKNVVSFKNDFRECFSDIKSGDIIFCDPPYVPLNPSGFTKYFGKEFAMEQQIDLVNHAINASKNGATVLICNHDMEITRELYKDASRIISLSIQRTISAKGDGRKQVQELIAIFS